MLTERSERPSSISHSFIRGVRAAFICEVRGRQTVVTRERGHPVAHSHTCRCVNPADVILLLKSSDFITHDLCHPFDCCIDGDNADGGGEGGGGDVGDISNQESENQVAGIRIGNASHLILRFLI